jgi:hypothetical protein
LRFDEAVQPAEGQAEPVRAGVQALRPQVRRGRAGGITTAIIPCEELRSTAIAHRSPHVSVACVASEHQSGAPGFRAVRRYRAR